MIGKQLRQHSSILNLDFWEVLYYVSWFSVFILHITRDQKPKEGNVVEMSSYTFIHVKNILGFGKGWLLKMVDRLVITEKTIIDEEITIIINFINVFMNQLIGNAYAYVLR